MQLVSRDENGITIEKFKVVPGDEYLGYTELTGNNFPDSILVKGAYNLSVE